MERQPGGGIEEALMYSQVLAHFVFEISHHLVPVIRRGTKLFYRIITSYGIQVH